MWFENVLDKTVWRYSNCSRETAEALRKIIGDTSVLKILYTLYVVAEAVHEPAAVVWITPSTLSWQITTLKPISDALYSNLLSSLECHNYCRELDELVVLTFGPEDVAAWNFYQTRGFVTTESTLTTQVRTRLLDHNDYVVEGVFRIPEHNKSSVRSVTDVQKYPLLSSGQWTAKDSFVRFPTNDLDYYYVVEIQHQESKSLLLRTPILLFKEIISFYERQLVCVEFAWKQRVPNPRCIQSFCDQEVFEDNMLCFRCSYRISKTPLEVVDEAVFCSICLETKLSVVKLPTCTHSFCIPCMGTLYKQEFSTCPYCRTQWMFIPFRNFLHNVEDFDFSSNGTSDTHSDGIISDETSDTDSAEEDAVTMPGTSSELRWETI